MSDDLAVAPRLDKQTLKALLARADRPGERRLAGHLGLLAASSVAIWIGLDQWWLPAALLAQGVLLIALFAPLHECIHDTAFRSRWKNRVVGWLCGLILLLPPNYFRAFHMAHHAHTQDPARDPELGFAKPKSWAAALRDFSGYIYWKSQVLVIFKAAFGLLRSDFITQRAAPAIKREARVVLAVYLGLLAASLLAQTTVLLWFWVIPVLLGQPFLRAYLLAEHWDCPLVANMRLNTRTTLTNGPVRFLAWNMPYHAEHHSYPSVPFHALPRLHALMRDELGVVSPGYIAVHRAFWRRLAVRG